jgi:ribonuclease D
VPADRPRTPAPPPAPAAAPIETAAEVEELARSLEGEDLIGIDTEADSFHSYFTKVCLVQISTRSADHIIDPLAAGSLAPLGRVFESTAVACVLHGADYDLRILDRDHGLRLRGLFDTMIAARFLGHTAFGLSSLLERYFGLKIPKEHQRADWSRRPLTPELLRYAATDTHHLPALHDRMHDELSAKGRLGWAREEFALLEQVRHQAREDLPDGYLKLKGARSLDRRGLAVLRAVFELRERLAREQDRAPFRILGNDTLLELAKQRPKRTRDLASIPGLPRRRRRSFDDDLAAAIQGALELPDGELPEFTRRPSRGRSDPEPDLGPLKQTRDAVAAGLGLEPAFLAPNALLEAAARQRPQSPEAFMALPGARRWQAEVLAAPLGRVLANRPAPRS